ncbi:MAG: sigma-54-dependent Fis family transcriptional regulator, partial [Gammaproteobacteria bacterium]|nr:sigma-54-dependent Fis family transcriptional regulator [Gammaproteobacteria bacterium]
MKRVLIINSDSEHNNHITSILEFLDCETDVAPARLDIDEIPHMVQEKDFILLGPGEKDEQVLKAYRSCREVDSFLPIMLLTRADSALEHNKELNEGIVARTTLPLRHQSVQHALQQINLYLENRKMAGDSRSWDLFRSLVGNSSGIRKIRRLIEQVANTEATVIILGESGTGKEVVARNIHYHSTRRYKPFVPVNCGAIPADLLESELFGHEKGAFTGAINARRGRFEMAEGGTLFLDEIGDTPLAMQVKLLRVLQERTFERVGSNKSMTVDVRIIAATHANLEESIIAGRFREDLYYRLNVFPIEMPPLRKRLDDLPLLVNDLIARVEHENRGSIRLTPIAVKSLTRYSWPGNVRELANLIERLAILFPFGVVDAHDLPEKYRGEISGTELTEDDDMELFGSVVPNQRLPREGIDLKEHLSQMEYMLITQALDEADGVVAHAAKRL